MASHREGPITVQPAGSAPDPAPIPPSAGAIGRARWADMRRRDFLKVGLGTGAAAVAAVAFPPLANAFDMQPPNINAKVPLFIRCIDTMKESRDLEATPLTASQIQNTVRLAAVMNCSHLTVDSLFSYGGYAQTWVDAIRQAGMNVWFRGYSDGPTINQWITGNPRLFAPGDIIDPGPEPENSSSLQAQCNALSGSTWTYWDSVNNHAAPDPATDYYNNVILSDLDAVQTAVEQIGIPHTSIINVRSTNSWFSTHGTALYPSTTSQLGFVTVDSYPEGTSTDPAGCASARLSELQWVASIHSVPILIGEMGYCNDMPVSDTIQQNVIQAELQAFANDATMKARLAGLNYWVGPGDDNAGGHTFIWTGGHGNWSPRPAAESLAAFFAANHLMLV